MTALDAGAAEGVGSSVNLRVLGICFNADSRLRHTALGTPGTCPTSSLQWCPQLLGCPLQALVFAGLFLRPHRLEMVHRCKRLEYPLLSWPLWDATKSDLVVLIAMREHMKALVRGHRCEVQQVLARSHRSLTTCWRCAVWNGRV